MINEKVLITQDPCMNSTYIDTQSNLNDMMESESLELRDNTKLVNIIIDPENTNYTYTNLDPFASYYITIVACYEDGVCSDDSSVTQIRTKRDEMSDQVSNITAKVVGSDKVVISWINPQHPNGAVLNFEIMLRNLVNSNENSSPRCVSRRDLINRKIYRDKFENLAAGNYSLSVRLRSLAGHGNFSDPIYFEVQGVYEFDQWIRIGIGIVFVFLIGCIIILIKMKRKIKTVNVPMKMPYMTFIHKPDDKFELKRDKVELFHELGAGNFGLVYEGVLRNDSDEMKSVAVKTVKKRFCLFR